VLLGQAQGKQTRRIFPYELIERASTARPPADRDSG
jgi:hypothetical protein